MRNVAETLKRRKGNRRWTALAKELGVSKQYLSNVYNGHKPASDNLLKALGLRRVERLVRA